MSTTSTPRLPFLLWLHDHCLRKGDNLVHEVSGQFPKDAINNLFQFQYRQALDRLRISSSRFDPDANHQKTQQPSSDKDLGEFNWVGYISRSLRNAGVQDQDLDAATSDIAVKLVHAPGRLFTGWNGQGPILARFKTAVRNASINAGKRTRRATRRHVLSFSEPGVEASSRVQHSEEAVKNFLAWVELRLGKQALAVLNHIVDGNDVKELVGKDGLTSYRVKKIVKELKDELVAFGERDPDLLFKVKSALAREELTLSRRFGEKRRSG
jgi:hypothetical protein